LTKHKTVEDDPLLSAAIASSFTAFLNTKLATPVDMLDRAIHLAECGWKSTLCVDAAKGNCREIAEILTSLRPVLQFLTNPPPKPCEHKNTGVGWSGGIKRVQCLDCREIVYAVKVD